jgi:hypothetical protein
MIIDCESCTVRGVACADCVVTFLPIPVRAGADGASPVPRPGGHPSYAGSVSEGRTGSGAASGQLAAGRDYPPDLDEAERRAIEVLARSGLVPPLRLVRAV